MKSKSWMLLLAGTIFLSAYTAFGQDLSQLPGRANRLWELRKQANKTEALQFIAPESRNSYLQGREFQILEFKVTGLEFTDDRNRVEVVSRVRSILPQLGEMDVVVKEPWIWKDRKWSMQPTASSMDLFSALSNKPPAPTGQDRIPPKVEIASAVDLGRHSQGEIIYGKVPFVGDRMEIRTISPRRNPTPIVFSAPVWTTPAEGYLPFTLDTTLVGNDLNEVVRLEALGINDGRAPIDVRFQAQINGTFALKQVPEQIDIAQAGQVELQIQNLSKTKPLKILSVVPHNPALMISEEQLPLTIEPGKSGSLTIRYAAQAGPAGAALLFTLSEPVGVGASPIFTVPLNVKPIAEERPSLKEELERIIKSTPKPNIP